VNFTSLLLLLFSVGASASAQLLLRHGMRLVAAQGGERGGSTVLRAMTCPWVLLGLGVFGLAALTWMATLARVPLSLAYPFNALGYLVIVGCSAWLLHERISPWTWAGSGLVVLGLIAVVAGQPS
jgi:drug/metabolite transporter (DMT)-like permease